MCVYMGVFGMNKQEAAIRKMKIQQTAHMYKQKIDYCEWKYGMLKLELKNMENLSKHIDKCVVCVGHFKIQRFPRLFNFRCTETGEKEKSCVSLCRLVYSSLFNSPSR